MGPFRISQVDNFTRKIINRKPCAYCSYKNKVFGIGSKNSCNEDTSWEKQYPSDKIFFRGYGNVIKENNQEYDEDDTESQINFSDDIKVR